MKEERQERDQSIKDTDLKKPIPPSIYELGGDNDPCFGKLYDPSNATCRICGDIELCGIVFSRNLNKKRDKVEATGEFIDLEDLKDVLKKAHDFVVKKKTKGMNEKIIIKFLKKKFQLNDKQIETLLNL